MAIKPISKRIAQDSLATGDISSNTNTDEFSVAGLFPINPQDNSVLYLAEFMFLLNPSSWRETKTVNWNEKIVPGNSDPVLQWSSSGARTVSFEALVTNDTYNTLEVNAIQNAQKKTSSNTIQSFIGSIAARFSGTSGQQTNNNNTGVVTDSPKAQVESKLSIKSTLDYYRSLAYPTYNENNTLQSSPPLLVLADGNAITKLTLGDYITENDDLWVLKELNINVTKQLPSLSPMEATVSFTLIQYNIRSFSSDRFTNG